MRTHTLKLGVFVLATVVTAVLAFAEATTTKPSEKYVLTLHSVFGAEPQRWVFLLKTPDGGIGITSSDRLQSYIELMVPKNATLEWVPTCTTRWCWRAVRSIAWPSAISTLIGLCTQTSIPASIA